MLFRSEAKRNRAARLAKEAHAAAVLAGGKKLPAKDFEIDYKKISKEDVILTDKLSRIVGFNRTIQTQSVISDLLSIRYDKQLKYDPTFISDVATLNPNKIRSDDFHHSESGEIFRYDYTLEEYVLHSDRYAGELSTF